MKPGERVPVEEPAPLAGRVGVGHDSGSHPEVGPSPVTTKVWMATLRSRASSPASIHPTAPQ
jgi:hypothetical protein